MFIWQRFYCTVYSICRIFSVGSADTAQFTTLLRQSHCVLLLKCLLLLYLKVNLPCWSKQKRDLKGQCHEIFNLWFSVNLTLWPPQQHYKKLYFGFGGVNTHQGVLSLLLDFPIIWLILIEIDAIINHVFLMNTPAWRRVLWILQHGADSYE